jgi:hypothetical protein
LNSLYFESSSNSVWRYLKFRFESHLLDSNSKIIHISICGPDLFEPDLPSKPKILLARKSIRPNRRRLLFLFHFSRPSPVSIRPKQPCQPTWPCGLHGPLRPSPPRIHPYLRSRLTRCRRLRQSPCAATRLSGLSATPSSPQLLCPLLSTKNRTVAPSSLLPLLLFLLSPSFHEIVTINARHTPAAIPPPLTPCLTPSSAL